MKELLKLDHDLSAAIHRVATLHPILRRIAIFLASELIWLMVGTLFGAVLMYDPYRSFGSSLLLASGMVIAALLSPWLITITIAYLVKRERPYQHDGFKPFFQMPWVTPSFPSGHATYAFGLAAMAVGSMPALGWLFLGLACLVALGRVASGVHYVSDVIVGAIIGYSVVTVLLRLVLFLFVPDPTVYY